MKEFKLSRFSTVLHRFGITTNEYEDYISYMQHIIDQDYFDKFIKDDLINYLNSTGLPADIIDTEYRIFCNFYSLESTWSVRDKGMSIPEMYDYIVTEYFK